MKMLPGHLNNRTQYYRSVFEGGGGLALLEINLLTLKMLKINNLFSSRKEINNLTSNSLDLGEKRQFFFKNVRLASLATAFDDAHGDKEDLFSS